MRGRNRNGRSIARFEDLAGADVLHVQLQRRAQTESRHNERGDVCDDSRHIPTRNPQCAAAFLRRKRMQMSSSMTPMVSQCFSMSDAKFGNSPPLVTRMYS